MKVAPARAKLGDMLVYIFTEQSGLTAAKAKAAFGSRPSIPNWRKGFEAMYRPAG